MAAATAICLGGCGKQSTLAPHSPQSHDIRTLWWWMFVVAAIVFLGAIAMLVYGWIRRGKRGLPFVGESERAENTLVVVFGIAIPVVILVALFFVADVYVLGKTDAPDPRSTKLTVEVTGHQWWWEVRYPGTAAVTADEIHIPAQTEVNVVGTTADVIHSFWVPQLNRKIDLIPGRRNRVGLYADSPGVYRGQCAEFCGLQHSHMAFYVIADPPDQFRAWLANMAADAPPPAGPAQRAGRSLFLNDQCASCHTIRGTSAQGQIGPDLTHLASRSTIAALTLPNDSAHLQAWIRDPQHFKPGNKMPGLNLSNADISAIATYLRSLR
ncbi:MAG: cytochrome c oxidase subunit II [Solirubrobacterales bacterium]